MEENKLAELSDEKLIKRRDLLKGASIGVAIVFMLAIAITIYLFVIKESKDIPLATVIPMLIMPLTAIPFLIILGAVNKEIKSRDLKKIV